MFKLFSWSTFFTLAILLLFIIQEWRDPEVDPNYIPAFYHNQTQIWEGNGYLALQGLNAPADFNFYTYGQQKVFAAFSQQQAYKKALKVSIPPTYPIPDIITDTLFLNSPESAQLRLEDMPFSKPCRYITTEETNPVKPCLTPEQLKKNIQKNRILWERFNTLPDYKVFSTIPFGMESFYHSSDLIQLSGWKAGEILETAAAGDPEQALLEWRRFTKLYRTMLSTHDSFVFKAIIMVVENNHRDVYDKLLRYHPELSRHVNDIAAEFPIHSLAPQLASAFWSDEWAQMEESIVKMTYEEGPQKSKPALRMSTDMHNRLYQCANKWRDYTKNRVAGTFFTGRDSQLCNDLFPNVADGGEMIKVFFTMTGNPISNIVHILLVGGSLKGQELIGNLYKDDLEWEMSLLGTRIINEKIPPEQIPAYIQRYASEEARLCLRWDQVKNRLFFEDGYDPNNHFFYFPDR